MSDLIRRGDLVKELNAQFAVGDITRDIANDILNHIPSAEPERTAKVKEGWGLAICESCKKRVYPIDIYCSHCGAKLEWSGNE